MNIEPLKPEMRLSRQRHGAHGRRLADHTFSIHGNDWLGKHMRENRYRYNHNDYCRRLHSLATLKDDVCHQLGIPFNQLHHVV